MQKMCKFTSSCICPKSHPSICSPLKYSIVSNDSICGQRRPWSDCANAQSDLGLHYPHMPDDMFLQGVAHILICALETPFLSWITFCISFLFTYRTCLQENEDLKAAKKEFNTLFVRQREEQDSLRKVLWFLHVQLAFKVESRIIADSFRI